MALAFLFGILSAASWILIVFLFCFEISIKSTSVAEYRSEKITLVGSSQIDFSEEALMKLQDNFFLIRVPLDNGSRIMECRVC
jgi:hypothetical protein